MNYWIKTSRGAEFMLDAPSEISAAKLAAQMLLETEKPKVLVVNNLGLCPDAYLAYGADGETVRFEVTKND